MRYLSGGDIIQESIQAVAVGPDMPLKQMPAHPQAEHLVSHGASLTQPLLSPCKGVSLESVVIDNSAIILPVIASS